MGGCPTRLSSAIWTQSCPTALEAQQRYFPYRTIIVAIVSQNCLCLFLWGIAQLSRDTLQKGYRRDVHV